MRLSGSKASQRRPQAGLGMVRRVAPERSDAFLTGQTHSGTRVLLWIADGTANPIGIEGLCPQGKISGQKFAPALL
jgi:hypothetical protein